VERRRTIGPSPWATSSCSGGVARRVNLASALRFFRAIASSSSRARLARAGSSAAVGDNTGSSGLLPGQPAEGRLKLRRRWDQELDERKAGLSQSGPNGTLGFLVKNAPSQEDQSRLVARSSIVIETQFQSQEIRLRTLSRLRQSPVGRKPAIRRRNAQLTSCVVRI
jgi:hypothetical protein